MTADKEVSVLNDTNVYTLILSNYDNKKYRLDDLKLRPYETFVIKKMIDVSESKTQAVKQ